MSKKQLHCIGCEQPTTDSITIHGLTLPYHPRCALEAECEARAFNASLHEALWERLRDRAPCDGVLPRADEIF